MATVPISLTITGDTPASVSITALIDLSTGHTPVGVTLPIALSATGNVWTGSFVASGAQFSYVATITWGDATTTPAPGVINLLAGGASGLIIDQTSLSDWMGALNLGILSNQDVSATTINSPVVQAAINAAEARVYGILGQLRCKTGTFFTIPFLVGGIAIKSSGSTTALPILQSAAHQYAGFLLNRWRQLLSSTDDESGGPVIYRTAKGWEKDADANLQKVLRWAMGFTDGQWVDLDLNAGAVIGAPYQSVHQPLFAGANVGPDGRGFRRIRNTLDWWNTPIRASDIFALVE